MTMNLPTTADGRVKVKRDGPRGWHWIAASNFDPAVHELVDDAAATLTSAQPAASAPNGAAPQPAPAQTPMKRGPGRPRKHPNTGASNAHS